jgi:hypothetical protein
MPAYIGAEIGVDLISAQAAIFDLNLGYALTTGIGLQDGSLEVEVAGCGITIGKRVGISAFGTGVSIDFGRLFWESK